MPRTKYTLNFKTHVHLKSIIGKDLINNDNIAVLELVKNAFDAQAKSVDIIFENIQKEAPTNSRLIIADDGTGMSLGDLETKWLNIAYSEKRKSHTQDGRMMAGAKGVGRFSCDRLGEQLNLYTRTKGESILLLEVNWRDFEVESSHELEIQQIALACRTITDEEFLKNFKRTLLTGTLLEIKNLRSTWTQWQPRKKEWSTDQLLDLRHYLEKLASPSAAFNKNSFSLELHAPEFKDSDQLTNEHEKINGYIENKIFDKLPYTTTVIQSEITDDNEIVTTLTDKNREIVKIREKNYLKDLQGLRISIYYLNPYAKAYFTKQTGIRAVDYGSIFLFVNGFRVSGLGDYGSDWLRMEVRKTQGYARFLGSREVVGRIEIVDPNHKVKIVSSREGVVTDNLTRQIIDVGIEKYQGFFYKTLRRLERYVVVGLEWDKTAETTEEIENKILKSRNWKYNPLAEKYEKSQSEKDENFLKVIQPIVEQDTRLENIIDVKMNLELLANIKNETDQKTQDKFARFIAKHQIDISQTKEVQKVRREAERLKKELDHRETLLSKTREEKEDALKHARSEKLARQQAEQTLAQSEEKVASLEKVAYFQENQIDLLDSFTKSDITTLIGYLHHIGIYSDAIEKNMTNIGGLFKSLPADIKEILTDIDFDAKKISVLSRLGQRAFEELDDTADFDFIGYANQYIKKILKGTISGSADISVVNNTGLETFFLIGNPADVSVIIDNLINNSEKAKATHISIIFEKREKLFEMIYRDNGIGLLPEINDPKKIFELGFTTTKGSGIGLNHVSRIIEEMGGTVAVNPNSAKGFELIFSFGDKK